MAGITWTPLDPVPMTATRLPAKSTGVAGHSPVWYDSPRKSSRPGTSGKYGHRQHAGRGDEEAGPELGAVAGHHGPGPRRLVVARPR